MYISFQTAKFKFAFLETRRGSKIPTFERTYSGYKGRFVLEDGSLFDGIGFGYKTSVVGEVVFNTGMVGYTEMLTDPSYRGQILCLTYPLVGNYGVPSQTVRDEFGLPKYFESDQIQVKGLLIHNLTAIASHWSCIKTLDQWLYEEKIPGIYDIDTRRLTKLLRINGVMKGAMLVRQSLSSSSMTDSTSTHEEEKQRMYQSIQGHRYDAQNFMHEVSTKRPVTYTKIKSAPAGVKTIVLLDTGTKYSIIRNILKMGFNVVRLPWDASFDEVMRYNPSGVIISNGPGDPKICSETVKTASELIKISKPTLGICLGQQILALAGGADTYKLKFGHRGQNKPCLNLRNNITYITSQNHGYGVASETLERGDFKIWFSNTDDDTVEGIEHASKPIIAVQFHPEASPGPNDCVFVFQRFKELIENLDFSRPRLVDTDLPSSDGENITKYSPTKMKKSTDVKNGFSSSENLSDNFSKKSEHESIANKNMSRNRRKYDA